MTTATLSVPGRGILRYSRWDALLLVLALGHGGLLIAVPLFPVVALGLWWNSNTVAHYFIHRPFFRSRKLNTLFALYQTVLLGVPQSVWRDRHLAHHAGTNWRFRMRGRIAVELLLIVGLWTALLVWEPWFFLTVYAPGYLFGLCLCGLHGYYEHRFGTTSHYGAIYNALFFNDGYHAEHHLNPATHWTQLRRPEPGAPSSRWPAVLRWLDALSLDGLERVVLRSRLLQRFVLHCHERAFRRLLPTFSRPPQVCVVGGGLFPRTLLVLKRLLPGAHFRVVDLSAENLATARTFFSLEANLELVHGAYDPTLLDGVDLVVFPLAFVGDREAIYRDPPTATVMVHDWIWRRRGQGTIVSLLLLKRLNLVRP